MTELNDEDISKALWHLRGLLNDYLKPLERYGQKEYVQMLEPNIEILAWRFHWELEGVDEPYDLPETFPYPP